MRFLVRACLMFLIVSLFSQAHASEDRKPTPGGFTFGMSKADIIKSGAKVIDIEETPRGVEFLVRSMPVSVSDFYFATLNLGFNDKLTGVQIFSTTATDDSYGSWIISRFRSLTEILTKLYGQGEMMISDINEYMDRPDDLAFALQKQQASIAAGWKAAGTTILLEAGATSGDTFYTIRYVDDELRRKLNAEIARRDAKGF